MRKRISYNPNESNAKNLNRALLMFRDDRSLSAVTFVLLGYDDSDDRDFVTVTRKDYENTLR
jgi:hypothetical protein